MSEKTVTLKINGKTVEARKGDTVLDVARREGIDIPTICHHKSLAPDGSCRMCLVELGKEGGPKKITTSCTAYVEDGMEVITESEKIRQERGVVLDLLISRAPDSKFLEEMRAKYVEKRIVLPRRDNVCILCGLCVRVCDEVIGAKAITFNQRGPDTYVGGPFGEPPVDCIGCMSCAYVCPVDFIQVTKTEDNISIWEREFERLHCTECGAPLDLTPDHLELISKRTGFPKEDLQLCVTCKQKRTKETMQFIVDSQRPLEQIRR